MAKEPPPGREPVPAGAPSGNGSAQAPLLRLWRTVCPEGPPHPVDPGTLGEYAALLDRRGRAAAAEAFPAVAAHLVQGCAACEADLADLLAFLAAERQAAPTPGPGHLLRVVVAALIPPLSGAALGLRGTE